MRFTLFCDACVSMELQWTLNLNSFNITTPPKHTTWEAVAVRDSQTDVRLFLHDRCSAFCKSQTCSLAMRICLVDSMYSLTSGALTNRCARPHVETILPPQFLQRAAILIFQAAVDHIAALGVFRKDSFLRRPPTNTANKIK
eukprot:GHVU01173292.1.p1 GENE.GHVU01173292.1~~GHVU01173292.1.p1  ORF type:complete len:142 (-),score=3.57 GHVU01173292.1:241-666(-)